MLSVCTSGWGFHPVITQGSAQISAVRGLYLFVSLAIHVTRVQGSAQSSMMRGLYLFVRLAIYVTSTEPMCDSDPKKQTNKNKKNKKITEQIKKSE